MLCEGQQAGQNAEQQKGQKAKHSIAGLPG
jgi:hypothetical protein